MIGRPCPAGRRLGHRRLTPGLARRELVVNAAEAEVVVTLFRLYAEEGSLNQVAQEAARRGLHSKRRTSRSGRITGGGPFSRGQLHHLLTNPTYLGRIRHKDQHFAGTHPPIVSEALWARVQARLQEQSARPRGQRTEARISTALLAGRFRDETGDRLTPSHSQKAGRRHAYYVSHRLIAKGTDPTGWRPPARPFETLVADSLAQHLEEAAERHALLAAPDPAGAPAVAAAAKALIARIRAARHRPLAGLIDNGRIARDHLSIRLDPEVLAADLSVAPAALDPDLLTLEAPFSRRRRGVETRLVAGALRPAPDPTLIRALAQAHRWTALLRQGMSLADIARREGKSESLLRHRTPLAFLAPPIQARILDGTLPPDLTLERLIRMPLPLAWDAQIRRLGL